MKHTLLIGLPCAKTGQPQVGRLELHGENWLLVGVSRQRQGSVFRSEATADRTGSFGVAPGYPGCPSCGVRGFAQCGHCSALACYEPSRPVLHCPTCGLECRIEGTINRITSLGGG
jgi:hypothetical protein